jgi:hypothetical protein
MAAWPRSLGDGFSSGFADFGEIAQRLITKSGAAAWVIIDLFPRVWKRIGGLGLLFIDKHNKQHRVRSPCACVAYCLGRKYSSVPL